MTKKELLKESIVKITKQAGLETSGTFHLTSVSRDHGGLFIMEVMRPGKKRLCEAIRRVVTGFPRDTESSCIVLLPEVVGNPRAVERFRVAGEPLVRVLEGGPERR